MYMKPKITHCIKEIKYNGPYTVEVTAPISKSQTIHNLPKYFMNEEMKYMVDKQETSHKSV